MNARERCFHGRDLHPFSLEALLAPTPIASDEVLHVQSKPELPPISTIEHRPKHLARAPGVPRPEKRIPRICGPQLRAPPATMVSDPENGDYGIRCVCEDGENSGFMIQCEVCEFWLHGICVNVARLSRNESYSCPFCLGQGIRCRCGETMKYDQPLVQCTKCKMWSHKTCEDLDYGRIPSYFVCSSCGGGGGREMPEAVFERSARDRTIEIDLDRCDFLTQIPDGCLKQDFLKDLDCSELSFQETMFKYYSKYGALLFDDSHEFWRIFVESLAMILDSEKFDILNAIDQLTSRLLYSQKLRDFPDAVIGYSESLTELMNSSTFPRIDRVPPSIAIFIGGDRRVRTPTALDDGQFICELPGFIMHTDEVHADDGLDLSVLSITDSEIVCDLAGTMFKFARLLRRSFHFNTIVKLVRIRGEPRACLFATRPKGPLSNDKGRRGPAILENGEIVLPFDAGLPFDVPRIGWKDKRQKPKAHGEQSRSAGVELSLLSAFVSDIVPPLPIVLLPDHNAVEKYLLAKTAKPRSKPKPRFRAAPD
jgi:hypothetical protein